MCFGICLTSRFFNNLFLALVWPITRIIQRSKNLFGYIKPLRPQLRLCEDEAYKAVYCGLCGQLGKTFGPLARLTLSYDFAFLAMLYFAAGQGKSPVMAQKRSCHINPLRKRRILLPGEGLAFSADAAIIMLYHKLSDNIRDSGAVWKLGLPFVYPAWRKAALRRPGCEEVIARAIGRQWEVEQSATAGIDAACEPTAVAMQAVCSQLPGSKGQNRVLERIGYLVGRYVYLCDALDDLTSDLKTGSYNPFIRKYGLEKDAYPAQINQVLLAGRDAVYLTAGEAGKTYQLLEPAYFGPVLENIFYLGLCARVDEILKKRAPKLTNTVVVEESEA